MTATTITAQGGDIGTLAAASGINAAVSAHGSIAALRPGAGNLAGSFTALTGSLPDITCDGSITADLTAGTTIGNLTASQNIAATVFATGSIGQIVTLLGNISGNITSQNGNIGKVIAGSDLSANITAIAGSIGDLIAGHNLAGNMSAHTSIGDVIVNGTISGYLQTALGSIGAIIAVGDITNFIAAGNGAVDVWTHGSVTGSISATANVSVIASGSVSGDIYTKCGTIAIRAGGDITSGKITASGDIFLKALGDINYPQVVSTHGSVAEIAGATLVTNATSPTAVTFVSDAIYSDMCVAGVVTSVDSDGGACFAAGTLIMLADGTRRRIELVVDGTLVLAVMEDDPLGTPVPCRVEKVFHNKPARIYHVHIADQIVRCTALHPFYVKGHGWKHAKDLTMGDLLVTDTGETLGVQQVEDTRVSEPVFNLHVERAHTYFVAVEERGASVLVHNASEGYPIGLNSPSVTNAVRSPATPWRDKDGNIIAPYSNLEGTVIIYNLTQSPASQGGTPNQPQQTVIGTSIPNARPGISPGTGGTTGAAPGSHWRPRIVQDILPFPNRTHIYDNIPDGVAEMEILPFNRTPESIQRGEEAIEMIGSVETFERVLSAGEIAASAAKDTGDLVATLLDKATVSAKHLDEKELAKELSDTSGEADAKMIHSYSIWWRIASRKDPSGKDPRWTRVDDGGKYATLEGGGFGSKSDAKDYMIHELLPLIRYIMK